MGVLSAFINRLRALSSQHGYGCDICDKELFDYPAVRVCDECQEKLWFNNGLTCPKCGRQTLAQGVCLACKSNLPRFTRAFSVFSYVGTAAKLVNGLKNGKRRLAWYLGEQLASCFLQNIPKTEIDETHWLFLPVPLTPQREKERGYNQAEALAVAMAQALEKQGVRIELDVEGLQKRRESKMQKHLSKEERSRNVEGAYHVHKRKLCKDRRVILIDDILTTGATGSECAKLLFGAGAKSVYVFTVASAPEQKQTL